MQFPPQIRRTELVRSTGVSVGDRVSSEPRELIEARTGGEERSLP